MNAQEFISAYWPKEYGHTWDEVVAHLFMAKCCDDIQDTIDDILVNGIIEPVIVQDGEVLNGHHRVAIAIIHDLDVPYIKWEGEYEV